MWLVTQPEHYDVIVTGNLFGDIVSDLGAALQGGLGMAASANIHPGRVSMFEPCHGSAPKYTGRNVASPLATIASVGMMLNHLGETAAALLIEEAIAEAVVSRRIPSVSARSGMGTNEVGDVVADLVATGARSERAAQPVA
jgi:3-isopropylmalate dehydrogenase